jgi:hypothetical protein
LSTQLLGDTPELGVGERLCWSVPVVLTLPARGVLGQVGVISVDATTGDLLVDQENVRRIAKIPVVSLRIPYFKQELLHGALIMSVKRRPFMDRLLYGSDSLTRKLSVRDAEAEFTYNAVPFGVMNRDWKKLKAKIAPGDELWEFKLRGMGRKHRGVKLL